MYIEITTRCNMSCAHCCVSANSKGKDMNMKTYIKAIELAQNLGYGITLGGGEPTLHRNFINMLITAMTLENEMPVFVITNGSNIKISLLLAKLAKVGAIGAELSIDRYHDNISYEVKKAFTVNETQKGKEDYRAIRTVRLISKEGRAIDNNLWNTEECVCEEMLISVDGSIHPCGCSEGRRITLGTVFKSRIHELPYDHQCVRVMNGQDDDYALKLSD